MMSDVPYVQFRFNGEVVKLSKEQFEQCLRDARLCRCGACLCCRAEEYYNEVKGE
jgi:hypothetical protein